MMDLFSGRRSMQTLRKLPTAKPSRANIKMTPISIGVYCGRMGALKSIVCQPCVIIVQMRKESSRLWEQAQEDLDTAEKLLHVGKYYASVFFSEQAAEKALKVMYLEKKRRMTFTHDLVELAEELGAPEDVSQAAAELSPDYVMTRYPDAANAMPAKLYGVSSAEMHLKLSRAVMQWAKNELRLET